MPVGEVKQLRVDTDDGVAQVRYQIQEATFAEGQATVVGEVVHDSPLDAATDIFVKVKFTVNGEVRRDTQQIPLSNKQVRSFERTLDNVGVNAEVGFAAQATAPGGTISDSLIFYDFVTASFTDEADSLEPQAVEGGINRLRMEPGGATLTPGEERTLVIEGITADGTQFPLTDGLSFTSSNPGVVTVDADGRLEAIGRGSAAVTATFDGGIGEPSITENFTVEPPQLEQPEDGDDEEEQPLPPEEPEPINPDLPNLNPEPGVYVLPFGVLNAAPFLTGVPDVTINVPTLASIRAAVDNVTLSPQQARTAAGNGVTIPEFPDVPSAFDIFDELTSGEPFNSVPTLQELRTETQDAVDPITTQIDGSLLPEGVTVTSLLQDAESTVSDLQTTLDTTVDDTIETADNAFESVQSNLQDSVDTGIETVQGEITTAQTTLDEIQGTAADFDGVTLPGLQDSVDSITGDLLGEVPDIPTAIDNRVASLEESLGLTEDTELVFPQVPDFVTAVEDELIPTVEAADGTEVGLLDATPRFISIALEDFLDDALSADTKQRARELAQEGQ